MLTVYRSIVNKARLESDLATRNATMYAKALADRKQYQEDIAEASRVAQEISEDIQLKAYGCIATTVSRCLEAIFKEPYEFKVEFVQKRGRVEVDLWFVRGDNSLDPMAASGGGVVDVAAFALRLASILMMGTRGSRVLVLDEPFKFVSAEYRSGLCDLLEMLASELGVQIIMVSHIEELRIGNVIEMSG